MLRKFVIVHILVTYVAMNGCSSVGRDGAKLESNGESILLRVFDCMVITARAIKKATSATNISGVHAEPQVRLKITLGALSVCLDVYVTSHQALVQVLGVHARLQLEFPLRDCALIVGRRGQQNGVNHACYFRVVHWQLHLANFTVD